MRKGRSAPRAYMAGDAQGSGEYRQEHARDCRAGSGQAGLVWHLFLACISHTQAVDYRAVVVPVILHMPLHLGRCGPLAVCAAVRRFEWSKRAVTRIACCFPLSTFNSLRKGRSSAPIEPFGEGAIDLKRPLPQETPLSSWHRRGQAGRQCERDTRTSYHDSPCPASRATKMGLSASMNDERMSLRVPICIACPEKRLILSH